MRINRIILENIGPYVKENVFDLSVENAKNIVLIGGKNGSGKTTLLKAIRYGLFGSFCLGQKTDTKRYFDEILNLINTDKKRTNNSITIDLTISEDLKQKDYTIKRYWIIEKNSIEEKVEVSNEGLLLTSYDTVQFFERLKSFTSPQLINSFIFDGEKIGNIIENNETPLFIKESFESIFNINILRQLNSDLNMYLDKKAKENISSKELTLHRVISNINILKSNIKVLEDGANDLKHKIEDLEEKKKQIGKKFASLGGLTARQQRQMNEEANRLSKEMEDQQRVIKVFMENELPFFMNYKLLSSLKKSMKNEIPLNYLKEISKIEKYLKTDLVAIKEKLSSKIKDKNSIHSISEENAESILNRIKIIEDNYAIAREYVEKRSNQASALDVIRDKLEHQEDINEFENMLNEANAIDENLLIYQQEYNNDMIQLNDYRVDLSTNYEQLDYLNNEIRKSKTYDNSFIMATKTLEINDKYISYLVNDKLNDVSNLTCTIFNETIRKENYISNISIDENYDIHIFDINGEEMSIKKLSAGEMQLLMSSIIWAMFKASGRKELFIFDTPLARLDVENRLTFINNIVKTIGDQVIILSTDSEIVGENYLALKKNVIRKYLLNYKETSKSTRISAGYF